MTRTVPSGLQTHLDGATTSTATLWTITRQDAAVLRFTDHDADIAFGGNTYVAAVGYQRTDIASNATLAVDSLDVQGILNSAEIAETDLRGGRYDYAEVRISLVNWKDPDGDGEVSLRKGWFGEIIFDENSGTFSTELRGLSQVFSQNIVEQFGRYCRHDIGDGRCNRDNLVPILPDVIQASTTYAIGDLVRAPRVGAASPAVTEDYQDTHYVVTTAGSTGTGVNNFPTSFATVATPATTLAVDDTNTFSRAAGSFLDDGWEVDMVFASTGFTDGANNGTFRIAAVAALTLDVTASTLVAEAGTGDETLTHIAENNGVVFSVNNALRVAGEVIEVISQSQFIVGPPGGPGGGLLKHPVFVENSGFETGDLTAWTITIPGRSPGNSVKSGPVGNPGAGAFGVHSGTYAAHVGEGAINSGLDVTEMIQDINVSDWAAEIDAGAQTVTLSWWMRDQHTFPNNFSSTQVDFDFFDVDDVVISSSTGTELRATNGNWQQKSQQNTVPANTRTIRVKFRADGGGSGCTADDLSISTSFADTVFPDDEFNYGVLTFDSGLNAGLSMDIKDYDSATKTFTLYQSMPYVIAVGDKLGVHIGCNKEPSRCLALENKLNFGGFEFIPGDDEFLRYPDSPY